MVRAGEAEPVGRVGSAPQVDDGIGEAVLGLSEFPQHALGVIAAGIT